eukprot:15483360-Alexandrium_andersonii.AAC.1
MREAAESSQKPQEAAGDCMKLQEAAEKMGSRGIVQGQWGELEGDEGELQEATGRCRKPQG